MCTFLEENREQLKIRAHTCVKNVKKNNKTNGTNEPEGTKGSCQVPALRFLFDDNPATEGPPS